MTRHHRRHAAFPVIAALVTAAGMASPLSAQSPDWRVVDNPYPEDIEYAVGTTHEPGVEKFREIIRCCGPTIRLDLGKQAEGPEA